MGLTYFKRYRMELDLTRPLFPMPELAPNYTLIPWRADLVRAHAQAKFNCFRQEIDANVFPCLGDHGGCLSLMSEIVGKDSFVPEATWLAGYSEPGSNRWEYCGTIQGIRDRSRIGAIQNLGIVSEHRNRHLGSCLMHKSLEGFRANDMRQAHLEVTAKNSGAIRLYERMGFRWARTVYKAVDVAYA